MLKSLAFFLLSLFVIPSVSVANTDSFSSTSIANVTREGEESDSTVLHGYTYTDVYAGGYYDDVYRYFDSYDFTVGIDQTFKAPSGYSLTTNYDSTRLTELMDQMEFIGINYGYSIGLIFNYYIRDTLIYLNSTTFYTTALTTDSTQYRTIAEEQMMAFMNDCSILETSEVLESLDITLECEINFFEPEDNGGKRYNIILTSETYTLEPFDDESFVWVEYSYYHVDGDEYRININFSYVNGFFYEQPNYNENGWHTDEMRQEWDFDISDWGQAAVFTLEYLAYETIPIATVEMVDYTSNPSIEINSYPSEPMPLKAKVTFVSGGVTYSFYSKNIYIQHPSYNVVIDGDESRTSVVKNTVHNFKFSGNLLPEDPYDLGSGVFSAIPVYFRLNDKELGHDLYDGSELPETGILGHYYYLPSSTEIDLYNAGKFDELNSFAAEGEYYVYSPDENGENPTWTPLYSVLDFEFCSRIEIPVLDDEGNETGEIESIVMTYDYDAAFPYAGIWYYTERLHGDNQSGGYNYSENAPVLVGDSSSPLIEVISAEESSASISLNVPDEVKLVTGGGQIDITPKIDGFEDKEFTVYYETELDKDGVITCNENQDGIFTITPINVGYVNLTIFAESKYFSKISKTISVRVLNTDYDSMKIVVPDGFHPAGNDLTASVDIKGFTGFQNLDVQWSVTDKKGNDVAAEKLVDNGNATITILSPESNNYTIKAIVDGVELNELTVQVRQIDLDSFLRINIWWIALITILFVLGVIFLKSLTKHGRTTVQNIEHVYNVYCSCVTDDKLSKEELKKIKRTITKCLHRCEDLNMDALNQYEKATRYLRKSLIDVKSMLQGFDTMSAEDKEVLNQNLSKDLNKALTFAKEIEDAKDMIEKRHSDANRRNYEVISDDEKDKK